MRVFVYYNLHRHCLSIRALEGAAKGLVIAHAAHVALLDVEFRVSEAGRQRVLRTRQKNVHAGVVGTLTAADALQWRQPLRLGLPALPEAPPTDAVAVTYCPYRYSTFVERKTGCAIHQAACVWLWDRQVWAARP